MKKAGYRVSDHFFDFEYNADRTPPVMRQTAPAQATYTNGRDFASMTYSGSGDATAETFAVDLNLTPEGAADGTSNSSGCTASDFAGFVAGKIALMQRGTCPFADKAANAKAAGAAGAIVMNEGNNAGRAGVIQGTLGGPGNFGPTAGTTFAIGKDLANDIANGPTGSTVQLRIDRVAETRTTRNVIAETREGKDDNVLVVGAHLDSVPAGPGINDNGSGSAAILETAEVMAKKDFEPRNKIRFMWYSAEEFGLLGSEAYVEDLPQAERDRIFAMLNFDMVGSPNYVRFVYDGDNSAFPVGPNSAKGPEGSGELERIFHDYFGSQGLASDETPFSGRSDYGPFIAEGVDIPAGGLFTGAEGTKTAAQAAVYGGTAGEPYDHCYHLACDTFENVNLTGLHEMSDAIGHGVLTVSQRKLKKHPLVNPSEPVTGTGGTTPGGGGLHDDHDHEVEGS
jgi:Zn-dependent M28 family amino/carboxypeptidase